MGRRITGAELKALNDLNIRANNLEDGLLFQIASDLKINHDEDSELRIRDYKGSDMYYGLTFPMKALEKQTGESFSFLKMKKVPTFSPILEIEYANSAPHSWMKVYSHDPRMEPYKEKFEACANEIGRRSFSWIPQKYSQKEE